MITKISNKSNILQLILTQSYTLIKQSKPKTQVVDQLDNQQFHYFLRKWDGSVEYFQPVLKRLGEEYELDYQDDYQNAIICLYKSHKKGAIENLELIRTISNFSLGSNLKNAYALQLAYIASGWILGMFEMKPKNLAELSYFLTIFYDGHDQQILETLFTRVKNLVQEDLNQEEKYFILCTLNNLKMLPKKIDFLDDFIQDFIKYTPHSDIQTKLLTLLNNESLFDEIKNRSRNLSNYDEEQLKEYLDMLLQINDDQFHPFVSELYQKTLCNLQKLTFTNEFRLFMIYCLDNPEEFQIKQLISVKEKLTFNEILFASKITSKLGKNAFEQQTLNDFFISFIQRQNTIHKKFQDIICASQLANQQFNNLALRQVIEKYLNQYKFLLKW